MRRVGHNLKIPSKSTIAGKQGVSVTLQKRGSELHAVHMTADQVTGGMLSYSVSFRYSNRIRKIPILSDFVFSCIAF